MRKVYKFSSGIVIHTKNGFKAIKSPKGNKKIQTLMRLPSDLRNRLIDYADKRNLSLCKAVEIIIEKELLKVKE